MPVSTSALTLAQYAVMSNDPLVQQITWSLLRNAKVLDDLPLIDKKTMISNGVRWEGSLPTPTWSKINVDPTVVSGTPTPYQEQAYVVRNAIDVDRFLVEDQNQIVDPRGAQADAYLESLNYDINDKWINNDHITGEDDAFVGMRFRLDNAAAFGLQTEMKIDGGGVDMSQAGMTAATANNFIELVQTALDYMGSPNGENVTIYLNDTLKRRFERAIRLLGAGAGFTMTKDAFDRPIEMYKNAKVKDIGRKADQSTRIILNTETSTGAAGASTYTSMYFVRYDMEHVFGWQFDPLSPKDVGLIGNGGSTYRLLIDWAFGIYSQHTRGMARIYGIKMS